MSFVSPRIAPSVLSADFARLGEEVRAAAAAGADWLHVDVMDGHFVPNITIGPAVVAAIRGETSLPLDVHLMITDPGRYVAAFVRAGANWLSVHQETCTALREVVAEIHALGARAAVAINPDTPVEAIGDAMPEIDMLLIMSVHPGFAGQSFIGGSLAKLREAARLRDRLGASFLIEVDGGITTENAGDAAAAGADVIVAGTAIFRARNYAQAIAAMRSRIAEGISP